MTKLVNGGLIGWQASDLLGLSFTTNLYLSEAVVGALYLDSGLVAVERFMAPMLDSVRERVIVRAEIYDPKSRFQEWAQSERLGTPQYVTVSADGPDHAKVFEVEVRLKDQAYGKGSGPSKQIAAQAAAQTALETIGLV